MKDITYIKLVDLDKSTCNKIVQECSSEHYINAFCCPHHIIADVIKIVGEYIRQARFNEETPVLQKSTETKMILEKYHENLLNELMSIKDEIRHLKLEH